MAVTIPFGEVVVGLGYSMDVRTVAEMVKVVLTLKLMRGQRLFLGVVLDECRRADAVRRLDDAAAEAAALSGVGRKGRVT